MVVALTSSNNHISEREFILEFFGLHGRELGNPAQHFTDNPLDVFAFVEENNKNKFPSFISVQPRSSHGKIVGLEKLFFDFDTSKKSDNLSAEEIESKTIELEIEMKKFLNYIVTELEIKPLVIKTRKGYHIYIYFDRVYMLPVSKEEYREIYKTLMNRFISAYESRFNKSLEYFDPVVNEDIFRLCRIPFSIHEKSGEKCIIVGYDLKPDKLRSVEFFKLYGLKEKDIENAYKIALSTLEVKAKLTLERKNRNKDNWQITHGFVGKIRSCFLEAQKVGEMCHEQRLAFLLEAYYSGIQTIDGLIELFRPMHDFDEAKTKYQIVWFFDHNIHLKRKPLKCSTIKSKGWCISNRCEIYRMKGCENGSKQKET